MLDEGVHRNQSELAGGEGVSTAAVSIALAHEAVIGRTRQRIDEYPEAVVREAVANALAHRDYGLVGAGRGRGARPDRRGEPRATRPPAQTSASPAEGPAA